MAVITVEMSAGYTVEQKRQLGKDITEAFTKLGLPADDVQIIIRETPDNCWIKAGNLCSDFAVPPGA